jgi:hypothetical protein
MKKSELKQLIKEEIKRALNENEFESFLNSLNISVAPSKNLDRGIDIGSDVAVIGEGPGVVIDIDEKGKKYTVDLGKKTKVVPFQFVQPINTNQFSKKQRSERDNLLNQIKQLTKEHKQYVKTFIGNLADFNSPRYKVDFKDEKWKLGSIADFYLDLGKQLWNMFKVDDEYITHSDEFEDLFLDILYILQSLYKIDRGENEDLENIVMAYRKIGDKIGAGIG